MEEAALAETEAPFLRLPLEGLRRMARANGKLYEQEVTEVLRGVQHLGDIPLPSSSDKPNHAAEAADTPPTGRDNRQALCDSLDGHMNRLQGLKRKLQETHEEETRHIARVKARIGYLTLFPGTKSERNRESVLEWRRCRLNRVLVDHLLREGYSEAARLLARNADIEELTELTLFAEASQVARSLQEGQFTEALQWCEAHKSKLRKAKSRLEFQLRLQQFLEKVRAGDGLAAVRFAREYLSEWAASELEELQTAMATLAFRDIGAAGGSPSAQGSHDNVGAKYAKLFDASRYQHLVELFRRDFCVVHDLSTESLLTLHLRVGLSVLKMPDGVASGGNNSAAHTNPIARSSVAWEESDDGIESQEEDEEDDDDDDQGDEDGPERMDTETRDEMIVDSDRQPPAQQTLPPTSKQQMPQKTHRFGDRTRDDPFCERVVRELAEGLPYAKRIHSKLICPVTQRIMNESNPPMVLPNGYVYSQEALFQLSLPNPGFITCPMTLKTCKPSEVVKAFIM